MATNVHGHAILERIIDAGGQMPLRELREYALANHGSDAQYFTCSASGMSLDELFDFLSARNKVRIENESIQVFAQNMCNDGAEHDHQH
jgi:probable metal-binding protein